MKYLAIIVVILLFPFNALAGTICNQGQDEWALETYSVFQHKVNEDSLQIIKYCRESNHSPLPITLKTFDDRLKFALDHYTNPCTVAKAHQKDDSNLEQDTWTLLSESCKTWLLTGKLQSITTH